MPTVFGVDTSQYQNVPETPVMMDYAKAKAAGAKFAYIKVSQGNWLDRDFMQNWQHADGVLPRGGYHFLDYRYPLQEQIDLFCQAIENDPGELPPALDYESDVSMPTRTIAAGLALKWLKAVEARIGSTPKLYTSPGYWGSMGINSQDFAHYPLWVAHYYVNAPTVPAPWTTWEFWQYTPKGDGIKFGAESAAIDLSWYNGTEAEFEQKYGLRSPTPTVLERLAILENRVNVAWTDIAALNSENKVLKDRVKVLEDALHILYLPIVTK